MSKGFPGSDKPSYVARQITQMAQEQSEKKMKQNKFAGFKEVQTGVFTPSANQNLTPLLPSGSYKMSIDQQGTVYMNSFNLVSDSIIDIPSPEFQLVTNEIKHFLTPETKFNFDSLGYLYKRSFLLHGKAGTGKTVIVNRVAQEVISSGGIVIFNPDPQLLAHALESVDVDNDRLTMIIFEEFDELLDDYEDTLLSLLDGEIQKNNVVYCATTNNFNDIPKRLIRPGRFSTILKVAPPNEECRTHYLNSKLNNLEESKQLSSITKGFTVDELKELVLMTKCFNYSVDTALSRIKESRENSTDEEESAPVPVVSKSQIDWSVVVPKGLVKG